MPNLANNTYFGGSIMDNRYNQIKKGLETIISFGFPSDIMKAVAVCLTLRGEDFGNITLNETDAMKVACRVLDIQQYCKSFQTYEERVLAVLRLAENNGSVDDVLSMDGMSLAQEIDQVGITLLDQVAEDYWAMGVCVE